MAPVGAPLSPAPLGAAATPSPLPPLLDQCADLAAAVENMLGVAPDFSTAEPSGCLLAVSQRNSTLGAEDALGVADRIGSLLAERGWATDSRGATEVNTRARLSYSLADRQCSLSVEARLDDYSVCSGEQPIAYCFLAQPPEQQRFDVELRCHPALETR